MTDTTQSTDISPLSLSDEEIMNMVDPEVTTEDLQQFQTGDDDGELDTQTEGDEITLPDHQETGGDGEETETQETDTPAPDNNGEEEVPANTEEQPVKEDSEFDYKSAYEKLTGTFKANGKEYTIDSPEEALALMQMGANYNMKMAAIKPNLKLIKTLEANEINDEATLNFLIDLHKGNPEAISKLLADREFDALSHDPETAKNYVPGDHSVSDAQLLLNETIESIKHSPAFQETANIVSTVLDAKSQEIISNKPQIIPWLNHHVETGIYPLISAQLEKAKLLGHTAGMSDIEAYQRIGDAMDAEGAFNHLFEPKAAPAVVVPTPKKDAATDAKKRAASSPKTTPTAPAKIESPLRLSDDEFEKEFDKLMGKFI